MATATDRKSREDALGWFFTQGCGISIKLGGFPRNPNESPAGLALPRGPIQGPWDPKNRMR